MNQPPLNPDALRRAADAVSELYADGHCPKAEDAAEVAVSAYLAAALPDADELLLVTIKLPKNPEHDPRNKKTGACEVSQECTDLTGEHHTVAVRSQKQVEALRDQFGHITRVERVAMNRDDPTAALPEVTGEQVNLAGWTCNGIHEPGDYSTCEECRDACDDLARFYNHMMRNPRPFKHWTGHPEVKP